MHADSFCTTSHVFLFWDINLIMSFIASSPNTRWTTITCWNTPCISSSVRTISRTSTSPPLTPSRRWWVWPKNGDWPAPMLSVVNSWWTCPTGQCLADDMYSHISCESWLQFYISSVYTHIMCWSSSCVVNDV